VAGFDFLNEPLDAAATGTFEHDILYPFYRRAAGVVRAARARQMLVLEPPLTRNLGFDAHPEPIGDPNLVYAPHLYTGTFGLPDLKYDGDRAAVTADYARAAAEAALQGAPLWVAEYGGNTAVAGGFLAATEQFVRDSLDEQEQRLVGSALWAYFPRDNTFSLVDVAGNEKGALATLLARPFPLQTAGVPQALHWDPDARMLDYTFAEDPTRRIPDPTILFVPLARQFPAGVVVETDPGDRAILDTKRNRIVLRRDRTRSTHTIRLRPAA